MGNTLHGIVASDGATVAGNTVALNGGFGLMLIDRTVGYARNVLSDNGGGAVSSGTSLGRNKCDGVVC
jgi:hypothetical protein